jgi:primosomal protein N' (replication factor Y)
MNGVPMAVSPLPLVARIAVEKTLYSFDTLYDYVIPDSLSESAKPGRRVVIPFGKGNRKVIGLIFSIEQKTCDITITKQIYRVLDQEQVFSDEMLFLIQWLKENTFCTYFDAVRTVIPAGLSIRFQEQYTLTEKHTYEDLTSSEYEFLIELKNAKSKKAFDSLTQDKVNHSLILALVQKQYITVSEQGKTQIGDETQWMIQLTDTYEEILETKRLTPKQKAVLNTLEELGTASVKEICYLCSVTAAVINNMVNAGIIHKYEFIISRAESAKAQAVVSPEELILSPTQNRVFQDIMKLMKSGEPKAALLKGITGSGKTSVFIKLIHEAVKSGKTALMLVPEISLTPQTVANFQAMFGKTVAVLHSGLSVGQRADEYKRIRNKEAQIVIGTRSAVFAPLTNIGIIVIDEEGEHTYKSEKSPRYHARDVAKQRCFHHKALLLLASATPSLQSRYLAEKGKYALFELNERYSKAVLPEVYIVDMKIEAQTGNRSSFSEVLLHEIENNLLRGEQSLLLLNRRGYHTLATCISCSSVVSCPNCGIALTYHKVNDSVICHYCGMQKPMPNSCEHCGGKYIYQSGTGTQRIEEELSEYFPKARILRMDADTTLTKNAYSDKFSRFGNGEYDIMVGTQMIAKGLDFENVTLVGILQIDKALYAGDFMSYERTFSLITQVVGRSGRGEKKGRAYLQTYTPDHYVLELAARQDYDTFYKQEMDVRNALLFPPYCDIVLIGFAALTETACHKAAQCFLALLNERLIKEQRKIPIRVLGPSKMGTGHRNGKYRYKLIIKTKNNMRFRSILNDVMLSAYQHKEFTDVSFYADINGEIP